LIIEYAYWTTNTCKICDNEYKVLTTSIKNIEYMLDYGVCKTCMKTLFMEKLDDVKKLVCIDEIYETRYDCDVASYMLAYMNKKPTHLTRKDINV